ncbi:hypothetical protein CFP65_5876 [Kitasatospora sp. MMS16-BH015]|uniref:hypothetical protein n=1 Tax=Kitasatospora sp. MMS16-BH015 TaxID=2018025 RepID=UPI000CA28CDB|nr:hypothetical protein [Kitasatospora sp. MMS16-BH015]AUG80557.1 hypothetical protein CFP65_5876 [Kitasatospora sp. MMS16-BH015]
MTDYLVVSTDPEERGVRSAVEQAALRRLLRGTAFDREPVPPAREEDPGSGPAPHCRHAQYYLD